MAGTEVTHRLPQIMIKIKTPAIHLYQFCFQVSNNFKHLVFVAKVWTQMIILPCQGQQNDFQCVKILKKSVMKKTTETAWTFSCNISEAVWQYVFHNN